MLFVVFSPIEIKINESINQSIIRSIDRTNDFVFPRFICFHHAKDTHTHTHSGRSQNKEHQVQKMFNFKLTYYRSLQSEK